MKGSEVIIWGLSYNNLLLISFIIGMMEALVFIIVMNLTQNSPKFEAILTVLYSGAGFLGYFFLRFAFSSLDILEARKRALEIIYPGMISLAVFYYFFYRWRSSKRNANKNEKG